MINISIVFSDMFEDSTIAPLRYIIFTRDHLYRLENSKYSLLYTQIINETKKALSEISLEQLDNTKLSSPTSKDSKHTSMEQSRANFNNYLLRNEDFINRRLLVGSNEYQDVFPEGFEAFYNIELNDFNILCNELVVKIKRYKPLLGNKFILELEALLKVYNNANIPKKITYEHVNNTLESQAIKSLTIQLTKNLLFISYNNIANLEAFKSYFDTSLLYSKKSKKVYKDVVEANSSCRIPNLEYNSTKRIKLKNKGIEPIAIQMLLDDTPVGNSYIIKPSKIIDKYYSDFFSDGNAFEIINQGNTSCLFLINEIE